MFNTCLIIFTIMIIVFIIYNSVENFRGYMMPYRWNYGWFGFPSVYDRRFSVPYKTDKVNPHDNCHKKCLDRYDMQYNKVNKCIHEYCY